MTSICDHRFQNHNGSCAACGHVSEPLLDIVQEYLHWRKVNPQIKGGQNYLKRLQEAVAAQ